MFNIVVLALEVISKFIIAWACRRQLFMVSQNFYSEFIELLSFDKLRK